jgi:hypothetical protein
LAKEVAAGVGGGGGVDLALLDRSKVFGVGSTIASYLRLFYGKIYYNIN